MMFSNSEISLLHPAFCVQLTVTLLHFLWQGALFCGLAWLLARTSLDARRRYAVHLSALVAMLVCVLLTFLTLGKEAAKATPAPVAVEATLPARNAESNLAVKFEVTRTTVRKPMGIADFQPATNPPLAEETASAWTLADFSPLVAVLYGLGVVSLFGRLLFSVCSAQRLRWRATSVTDSHLIASLQKTAKRMGLRLAPKLATCTRLTAPVVVGMLRPTILVPASLLSGLTMEEVSAILTHEMAHLRRNDLIVNLFQRIAESFLFFHPCVWIVSRQLSHEREQCCDDLVLDSGCERMNYVSALLRMAEVCVPSRAGRLENAVALSASGASPSEFKRRVLRLLGEPCSTPRPSWLPIVFAFCISLVGICIGTAQAEREAAEVASVDAVPSDRWPMLGGNGHRNNVAKGENIPLSWDVEEAVNVAWSTELGNLYCGMVNSIVPVVADGRVFIGSSNPDGELPDNACLVCLEQSTGRRLWIYKSPRLANLPNGLFAGHLDWPLQGMGSVPCVNGDRLYFVSNRCELVCLDVSNGKLIWKFDMIKEFKVQPHKFTATSPLVVDGLVLTGTSIGHHTKKAPSFAAFDKQSGKLIWQDGVAEGTILDGQWASPSYGVFDGVPQAIFSGGDGWLYSFDVRDIKKGKSTQLWKFDANPKDSEWILGGRGTRNQIMAAPVIYDGLVYFAVGQQGEHGEGNGHLWCIDPKRRGDISAELIASDDDSKLGLSTEKPVKARNEVNVKPNPNSGVVWHYDKFDLDADGEIQFEEEMHRAVAAPTISEGLVFITDFSGLVHCVDARSGKLYWTHDLFAASYSTPLVVDGKVFVTDEDGEVAIFNLSKELELIDEIDIKNASYGSVVCVDNTLFVASRNQLTAVKSGGNAQADTSGN